MKKVFIGCGVVVLLGLLFCGFVAWSVWPNMMKMRHEWTAAIDELNALDKQYPFDPKVQTPLDPARFKTMLDVHVQLSDYFIALNVRTEAMKKAQSADGGPGWMETIRQVFDQLAPVITEVADGLKAAGMGPQEFAFDTRVLWAVLNRVDAHLARPELDPLRGRYAEFNTHYEAIRKDQKELLELKILLADVPTEALETAEQVMAENLDLVTRAIAFTDVEYLYMQPQRIEEVERIEALETTSPATAPRAEAPVPVVPPPTGPPPAEPAPR